MRNREIAAHGGCNLFLRPKSKERATNTAFRWGYGVDIDEKKGQEAPKAPAGTTPNVDYVPLVNHYLEQRGYPAPAQEQGEEAPKKAAPRARPEHSSPQRGSGSTARQTRSTDTGTTETTEKPSVKSRLEALRAASEGMREPGRAPQAKGKTIPKSR